jgi:hypothetical protein
METLWQDIRYGIRMLLKAPSVSIVATIALALGIGANTAIFTVVNAVLLRPLPFANPEQLMMVWESDSSRRANWRRAAADCFTRSQIGISGIGDRLSSSIRAHEGDFEFAVWRHD